MDKSYANRSDTAFTIIELLVVIIIIGILVAITVIGYNGVTNQARESSAKVDLSQDVTVLESYYVKNGDHYPANLNAAQAAGAKSSLDTALIHKTNSDSSKYCLQANKTGANSGFYVTSDNKVPRAGRCDTYNGMSSDGSYTLWTGNAGSSTSQYWNNGQLVATNLNIEPNLYITDISVDHAYNGSATIQSDGTLRISGNGGYIVSVRNIFPDVLNIISSHPSQQYVIVYRAKTIGSYSGTTCSWGARGSKALTQWIAGGWVMPTSGLKSGDNSYAIAVPLGSTSFSSLILAGGGSTTDAVDWTNYALYTKSDWDALQSINVGYFDGNTAVSQSYN